MNGIWFFWFMTTACGLWFAYMKFDLEWRQEDE